MGEFILETCDSDTHARFDALPEFVQGVFESLFFTAPRPDQMDEGAGDACPMCGVTLQDSQEPAGFVYCPAHGCEFVSSGFGEDVGIDRLAPESWAGIEGVARRFMRDNAADLAEACAVSGYDMTQAGRDLAYTMNRHGVGFWDRRLGDVGDRLTEAAHAIGEIDLCAGDDMRVHVFPCPDPWEGEPESDAAPLAQVGGRYGAPMGRVVYVPEAGEAATVRRVTLDPGGYDAGGAYWGIGAPLWRAVSVDGANLGFLRAPDHAAAVAEFRKQGVAVCGTI